MWLLRVYVYYVNRICFYFCSSMKYRYAVHKHGVSTRFIIKFIFAILLSSYNNIISFYFVESIPSGYRRFELKPILKGEFLPPSEEL